MSAVLNDFFLVFRFVPALFRHRVQAAALMTSADGPGAEMCDSDVALIRENRFGFETPAFDHRDKAFRRIENSAVVGETVKEPASDQIGLDVLFDLQKTKRAEAGPRFGRGGVAVVVTDFDPKEDMLVMETQGDDEVNVVSQTVVAGGVLVAFDNGSTALLQGLRKEIPIASIIFVAPEGDENDDLVATEGATMKGCNEFQITPTASVTNAADLRHFEVEAGFVPRSLRGAAEADSLNFATTPMPRSATITLPGPVILEQATTANGLLIKLSTDHAARHAGPGTPSKSARIAAQSPEMAALS